MIERMTYMLTYITKCMCKYVPLDVLRDLYRASSLYIASSNPYTSPYDNDSYLSWIPWPRLRPTDDVLRKREKIREGRCYPFRSEIFV